MPGLAVSELMVAAGEIVAAGPPGTPNVALATVPADPWVDLGYVNEDGVTLTDAPSETNVGAWQSADPVLVLTTEIARTFAFNLMQWNPDVLAFALGGAMVVPAPTEGDSFAPDARGAYAILLRWKNGDGDTCQFWAPRGKVTGDVSAQLTRTATADLAATYTCTPQGGEDAWRYTSDAAAFAGAVVVLKSDGEVVVERNSKSSKSANGGA